MISSAPTAEAGCRNTPTGTVMLPVDTATSVTGTGTDLAWAHYADNRIWRALASPHRARHCPPAVPCFDRTAGTRVGAWCRGLG